MALITDGRFSGATHGFMVGHICPEAAHRGPLAAVREGDTIVIDVERRALDVELSDDEISARLRELPPFTPKVDAGVLAKYAALVAARVGGGGDDAARLSATRDRTLPSARWLGPVVAGIPERDGAVASYAMPCG